MPKNLLTKISKETLHRYKDSETVDKKKRFVGLRIDFNVELELRSGPMVLESALRVVQRYVITFLILLRGDGFLVLIAQ